MINNWCLDGFIQRIGEVKIQVFWCFIRIDLDSLVPYPDALKQNLMIDETVILSKKWLMHELLDFLLPYSSCAANDAHWTLNPPGNSKPKLRRIKIHAHQSVSRCQKGRRAGGMFSLIHGRASQTLAGLKHPRKSECARRSWFIDSWAAPAKSGQTMIFVGLNWFCSIFFQCAGYSSVRRSVLCLSVAANIVCQ